jgi:tyrocidine synthetase-3
MQAALAHQDIPFEEVVKNIITTRSQSITPIFQVMFGLQNTPLDNITHIDNINIQTIAITKQSSLYDISMNAKEVGDEIHVELDYKSALFERNTMQRFIESFMRLTENITTNPEANLNTLEIISPNDAKQQLHEWNNTKKDRHTHTFLHAFIEEQAIKTPNATALIYKEDTLNYEALNQQANQLAHHLLSQGIKAGDIVGVLLERNISLIVTLLAISKTGACYLPLSLSLPQAKLNAISENARIQFIITSANISQWCIPQTIHTIDIESISTEYSTNNVSIKTKDKALFNIIYTSGSTGVPKGVMVSHAALINRLLWMQETFPLTASDRVLHKTPYGFDVSVWEIFWPLMVGAQLVIAEPNEHRNPNYIHEIITEKKITVAHFVPSMLSVFLQTPSADSVHYLNTVFCSGEILTPHLADVFFQKHPQTQLVNLYGPTEAAIDVSYHICTPHAKRIPIGKPISNIALHVIDTNNALLPIGAIGELAIAGDGLAEGYLHQQELTERFFIANPFTPNTRLYKTGDLAHYDQQGNLHFIGRNDQQIKVRGFRVEIGEIEHTLNIHPDIADSRVYASIDNNNTLAITAYYIAKNTISMSDIRNHLANTLPSFMIPNTFVAITEWPLTANGKINRLALPEQQAQEIHHKPFIAPSDDIEKSIAKIWIDLLNVEKIGIHDNFFELGGHSLLATIAITRLQNEYHIKIPLIDIFKEPTIANFAQAIRIAQQTQAHSLQPKSDNEEEFTL